MILHHPQPPTKKKYLPRLPTERDGTLSNAKLRMASGHQYSPGGLHRLSESASSSPTTWRVRPWWFAHSLGVSLFISDGNKRRQRGHTSSSSSSSSSSSRFSDGGAWPSVLSANPPSLFIGEACTHVPRITHLRFLRAASETFPWHSLPNGLEVLLLLLLFSFFFLFPLHYLQPSTILSSKKKYFYIYAATAQQFVLANFPSFIRCYIKIRVLFRLILSWETIPESLRTEKEWGSKKKKETRETRCYPPAHPEHFLNHPLPIFRVPSDVSIDRVVIVQNDYSVVSRFPVSVPPFSGR